MLLVLVGVMVVVVGARWFHVTVRARIRRAQAEHIIWCADHGIGPPAYRFPATWRLVAELIEDR